MISALSPHSHNKMNSVISTPSSMSASTFCWGTDLSYEDHVSRHTPSGEWNHLAASIILDARSGRPSRRISNDSPFDSAVYRLQQSIQRAEDDEKRLLSLIQKTKEELKNFTLTSSDEESAGAGSEEEDDEDDLPASSAGSSIHGSREKTGKDPRWLQGMKNKKQQQQQALKRKSLLSSLKTQSDSLAEVQKTLADDRAQLLKQKMLQDLNLKLQKAICGAESSYRQTLDQDYLVKNIHYQMDLWTKKSAPLLPPIKMVQRLLGSPGAYKTVMVPEHQHPIIPLQEYLREDW
jgi:hypothetical protein